MFNLLVKVVLSGALLAAWGALALPAARRWLRAQDGRALLLGGWAIFRLLPFAMAYGALGLAPTSDVASYFWPQALDAARGAVVYRDFTSHYGPLFPYVIGLPLPLWPDSRAIVLVMLLVELLALALTYAAFRREDPGGDHGYIALIYLVAPGPFILTLLGGQEDVWMWLFGLLIYLAAASGPALAALAAFAGLLLTKPLFLLPALWAALAQRRPWPYLLTLGGLGLASLAGLWMVAGPRMLEVLSESGAVSPPNLWIVADLLAGGRLPVGSGALSGLALLATLALGAALVARAGRHGPWTVSRFGAAWTVGFCLLMLLSPKSLGNYAAIFLLPLTWLTLRGGARADGWLLIALNVLVSIQPSLWYRLGSPLHTSLATLAAPLPALEFALQLALLGTLAAIAYRNSRSLLHPLEARESPLPAAGRPAAQR